VITSVLNNGTYITTDLEIWNIAGNGTLVEIGILNNGTYSVVDTDTWDTTWLSNWTAFNSSWSPDGYEANTDAESKCSGALYLAGNGTCTTDLFEADTNTNAETICTGALYLAGNGTCTADLSASYDDAWINATIYNKTEVDDINTSVSNYVLEVNATNFQTDTDTFVANYSLVVPYTVLNNGTYSAVDTDTFPANYSTFLTHTTKTYVDAQNTSQTNYIGVQNTSIVNWVSNVFNVTRNNYVDAMDLIFNNSIVNWITDEYYTSIEVDAVNTSMKNYVDSNPGGYSTTTGTVTSIATTAPISGGTITTSGTISLDTATPSDGDTTHASTADQIYDWVVGLAYATTTYVNVQNSSVVNWVNDVFYTKTEVNAVNTSMKNYVDDTFLIDIVTDTNPQLGGYLDTNGQNIGSTSDEIENIYVATNSRIYFGDGQDTSIYYNGTALVIG